jgi:hypothetical protein
MPHTIRGMPVTHSRLDERRVELDLDRHAFGDRDLFALISGRDTGADCAANQRTEYRAVGIVAEDLAEDCAAGCGTADDDSVLFRLSLAVVVERR